MPRAGQPLNEIYRSVLVTGASSGIGREVAKHLLEEGLEVYGTSRSPDRAKAGLAGIHWLELDGSTLQGVRKFTENNRECLEQLDILVNNAGSAHFGSLEKSPGDCLDRQIQLLLGTPVELTRMVLPAIKARRNGCIVNVSSLAASFPLPFMSAYSAGKAGLSTFTRGLILSEGMPGITLLDFQAGDFRTAFNANATRPAALDSREEQAWEQLERYLQTAPDPVYAARDMIRAIRRGRSGLVRSGGFFQTRIAPLGARILPASWLLRTIQWYYKLPLN